MSTAGNEASDCSNSNDVATMSDFQFTATLDALLHEDNSSLVASPSNIPSVEASILKSMATTAEATTDSNSNVKEYANPALTCASHIPTTATHSTTERALDLAAGLLPGSGSAFQQPHLPFLAQASLESVPESTNFLPQQASSNVACAAAAMPPPSNTDVACQASLSAPSTTVNLPDGTTAFSRPYLSKRPRETSWAAISEDESERERRRQDRNLREQQRSQQITTQIAYFRNILTEANIRFKPDKFSTLATVVEYVKQLQDRTTLLETERQRLLDTVSRTTEIINNQYISSSTSAVSPPNQEGSNDLFADAEASSPGDETVGVVQGLDYKHLFGACPMAIAILSLDGRFLDSNKEFEELSNHRREELLSREATTGCNHHQDRAIVPESNTSAIIETPGAETTTTTTSEITVSSSTPAERNLSLFNILSRDDMQRIFVGMSEMLQRPIAESSVECERACALQEDFWCGHVTLCRRTEEPTKLCINLVRTPEGRPRFFNCTLVPLS